jgi:hypothetical protein
MKMQPHCCIAGMFTIRESLLEDTGLRVFHAKWIMRFIPKNLHAQELELKGNRKAIKWVVSQIGVERATALLECHMKC